MTLTFADPLFLWLLLLVPALALWRGRKGQPAAVSFPMVEAAAEAARVSRASPGLPRWLIRLGAVALLILALARPQVRWGQAEIEASGVDIVLAVDASGSMSALDFATADDVAMRLDIVKRAIKRFIAKRPNDRIGLVAFAREPYLISPVTLNHDWLLRNVDDLHIGSIDGSATAIGPAIGMSANRLRDLKDAETRIIVLLTDGEDNVQSIPPIAAAEAAAAYGVKIYTIAAGTSGRVQMPHLNDAGQIVTDSRGVPIVRAYDVSRVDEATLKDIAETTGGKFFRANDRYDLESIYAEIDRLEKSEVKLLHSQLFRDIYPWFTAAALLLLLTESILGLTRHQPLP